MKPTEPINPQMPQANKAHSPNQGKRKVPGKQGLECSFFPLE
jgi:hypothetical protein